MNEHFGKLGIKPEILDVIEEEGFKQPTSVQNKTIPLTLVGEDMIVTAATGSGKTLAYAIRLIQNTQRGKGVQALVLVPTRELAIQVGNVLKKFSKNKLLNILVSYGGGALKEQKEKLLDTDILVGTPGRISDYVEQELFQLGKIKTLVLDEVDGMITSQFLNELDFILKQTPKKKQTLVFSATIPKEAYMVIKHTLNEPKRITVDKYVDPKKLKQIFYEVDVNQKLSLLSHFLENERAGLSIIFTNRQDTADFLGKNLKHTGLDIRVVHGDMSQGKRNRVIKDFSDEKFDVLIATDIAARGMDIDYVSHVYNYNIPKDHEKYIHRIGRTARAGNKGKVINLISKSDVESFIQVMKEHKIPVFRKDLPDFEEVEIKKKYEAKKHRR